MQKKKIRPVQSTLLPLLRRSSSELWKEKHLTLKRKPKNDIKHKNRIVWRGTGPQHSIPQHGVYVWIYPSITCTAVVILRCTHMWWLSFLFKFEEILRPRSTSLMIRVLSHSESHPFKLSSGIVPAGRSVYGLGTSNGDGNVTVKFESKWELTAMSCIH